MLELLFILKNSFLLLSEAMRSRIYNQYIQGYTRKYVYDKKKVLNMFADIFGDYCCCSVHIDNHTGDREAKSSRGNRNHSVGAGLSKKNSLDYQKYFMLD